MLLGAPVTSTSHAEPPTDAKPVLIGNALRSYYQKPAEKRFIHKLALYEGRLYIAYGTSDSTRRNYAIYLDPVKWTFDRDTDTEGKVVEFDAEELLWARVIESDLMLGNYDPLSGKRLEHYRKRKGVWETVAVGPDGHYRDFFRFGGKLCTFDGSGDKLPYPRIRWSVDDGKTWSAVDCSYLQPDRTTPPGWEFFTFKGRLYAGMMPSAAGLFSAATQPDGATTRSTEFTLRRVSPSTRFAESPGP